MTPLRTIDCQRGSDTAMQALMLDDECCAPSIQSRCCCQCRNCYGRCVALYDIDRFSVNIEVSMLSAAHLDINRRHHLYLSAGSCLRSGQGPSLRFATYQSSSGAQKNGEC